MRHVTIAAGGRTHCLDVAERDLDGDLLTVGVLDDQRRDVLIELPRAGFGGEWLVVLPRSRVLMEGRSGILPWIARIVGLVLVFTLAALATAALWPLWRSP